MNEPKEAKTSGGDFIEKQIKRTNRNLLLTNVSILVGIVVLWLNNAFQGAGYWTLAIFGLIALACWNLVKVSKRKKNPSLHPINAVLGRIGSPQQIAQTINEEVKVSNFEFKNAIVTQSWLLMPSMYGLEITALENLAWVHKKITRQSTFGIPTSKEIAVVAYKRDGQPLEMACDEEDSDRFCEEVVKRIPWAVCGFSDDIQKLWDTDRAGFIAQVDQRKKELQGEVVETLEPEAAKEVPINREPQRQVAQPIQAERKRNLFLILFLIGVPLATFLIGIWATNHLEGKWREGLIKWATEEGVAPTEAGLASLSLANVCAVLTEFDPSAIAELCDSYNRLQLLIGLSVVTGMGGLLILLFTSVAGWIAKLHRLLLLTIFTPGLYISLMIGIVLLLAHGALILLAIYYGEGILAGQIHTGVMITIGIAMVTGVFKLIVPAFHSIRKIDTVAFGKLLKRDQHPKLWSIVEDAAKNLGALLPDHIVGCLGEEFYVTEADVTCLDGKLKGRTLVLSLPFMRQLTGDELLSIIGHELGHFRGADTAYSRYFYPIYKGTQGALDNLLGGQESEGSIIYLPVLGLLSHFMDVFSRIEHGFGRERELVADRCGVSLTSNEAMATALTKVYAYSGLWSMVGQSMIDALEKGQQLVNACGFFDQVLNAVDRETLLGNLSTSTLTHPTDTHPPLKIRMERLGVQLSHFESVIQVPPTNPSSGLISEVETLEKELTDLEHVKLLKAGAARLPAKETEVPAQK